MDFVCIFHYGTDNVQREVLRTLLLFKTVLKTKKGRLGESITALLIHILNALVAISKAKKLKL